jgi:hypothetical protein
MFPYYERSQLSKYQVKHILLFRRDKQVRNSGKLEPAVVAVRHKTHKIYQQLERVGRN